MCVGTSVYMAPEVVRSEQYNGMADVFSYAIIMYEVLFETVRPYGNAAFNVEQRVARDDTFRPEVPQGAGELMPEQDAQQFAKLIELMKKAWKGSPEERPDFATICSTFESFI